MKEKMRLESLRTHWPRLMGEPLSLHTRPARVDSGVLLINVDSPAWLQQIKYFKQDILEKLSEFDIQDVIFKHGRVCSLNAHQPLKTPLRPMKDLREDELQWITFTTSPISDDELRDQIRKTIKRSILRSR
jgi:predicted nucleic acid-binding Zn ribbon protein